MTTTASLVSALLASSHVMFASRFAVGGFECMGPPASVKANDTNAIAGDMHDDIAHSVVAAMVIAYGRARNVEARGRASSHVRHHLASGRGQDHAHREAVALRRRHPSRRQRESAPG